MFTDMSSSSVVKLVANQVLQIFLDFSRLCSSSNLTGLPFTHHVWHVQAIPSHDKILCPQYSFPCELFSLSLSHFLFFSLNVCLGFAVMCFVSNWKFKYFLLCLLHLFLPT